MGRDGALGDGFERVAGPERTGVLMLRHVAAQDDLLPFREAGQIRRAERVVGFAHMDVSLAFRCGRRDGCALPSGPL